MRVAVIGLGGTGSAACHYLARQGHTVVGYERFRPGHAWGSSHGESRVIRYTYPDHLYTAMMRDAYPLWDELERGAGESLLIRCGCLYFGTEGNAELNITEAALRDNEVPYEQLNRAVTMNRFPGIHLEHGEYSVYQQDGGFLRATRCVLAHLRAAREAGATLREEARVLGIEPDGNGVTVRTEESSERFDRAIIAAGPWMSLFTPDMPLNVTQQLIVYLAQKEATDIYHASRFPVWIDATTWWYGFPEDGVMPGVKLALHQPGVSIDPEVETASGKDGRTVLPASRGMTEHAISYASMRLPGLSDTVTHTRICLYTNTPDEDFIIDTLPDQPNVLMVSGCSGHGFKFTALLGKIAADWADHNSLADAYPLDLTRFSRRRFVTKKQWSNNGL